MSDRSFSRRFAHLVVALVSCIAGPALAQPLSLSHYVHTAWRLSDLQLDGRLMSIAQGRDGYLWLGTEAGLFRFDGVRARRWQPPAGTHLPSEEIRSLRVSRDGTLWIGTTKGLASWKNNRLTIRADVPALLVFSLFEDSRGTVWVGLILGRGAVCAVQGDAARCDEVRLGATTIVEDNRGTIWVLTNEGALWQWAPVAADRRVVIPFGVRSIAQDEAGNVIAKTTRGIRSVTSDSVRPDLANAWAYGALFRSRDGAIWISTTTTGLLHLAAGRVERFGVADGLSAEGAARQFEDREGNVWILTEGGLDRFRPSITDAVSPKRGITNAAASSVVATPDGSVWIGGRNGLQRVRDGRVTLFRIPGDSIVPSSAVPTRVDQIRGNQTPPVLPNRNIYARGTDAKMPNSRTESAEEATRYPATLIPILGVFSRSSG